MIVALVDDEKNVRLAVKTLLSKEGFEVWEHANGQLAWDAVLAGQIPDIFILDVMMPVMDGISLLRKIRERGLKTPVMFLTSRDEEFDKVLGLELGADDYLCKPFSTKELVARIHVLQRRLIPDAEPCVSGKIVSCEGITLNTAAYTASLNDAPLVLTVTEFRILQGFIEHQNTVLTREQLIEMAYPDDTYLNDRAVDCHIKRLRKKLPDDCIETVYGLGYRFITRGRL